MDREDKASHLLGSVPGGLGGGGGGQRMLLHEWLMSYEDVFESHLSKNEKFLTFLLFN